MMVMYATSMLIILGVLAGWVGVQHLARAFAVQHPEFGPVRDEGEGCGLFCLCQDKQACPKRARNHSSDEHKRGQANAEVLPNLTEKQSLLINQEKNQ